MIFSLCSVIIPFPPRERKDRNNRAEIYCSPGAELLCPSKWKTRAAVAEWDTVRSRISLPHGASVRRPRHGSLQRQTVRRRTEECRVRHSMYDYGGTWRLGSCLSDSCVCTVTKYSIPAFVN